MYKFLEKNIAQYDVIFADPPYDFEFKKFEEIVRLVFENNLLTEEGVLIVEHSKHTNLTENAHLSYQKKYGGNMFSFFENNSELE